jgi:hypothetical protein
MSFRSFSRIRVLAISLAAVTATSTLVAIAGAAGPAAAATSNGCPASKTVQGLPTASNVAAAFSVSGKTATYTFSSLTNENPVGGVPGLIKYCVYPNPATPLPTSDTVAAHGANGQLWVYSKGSNNFAFVRPGGDKTNIPLDGTTGIAMGSATWNAAAPTNQTIILHINDPTVCTSLFGSGTSATCFVKPSTGPICNAGDSNVAYNAMPTDVVNCLNPAIGFEAQSASEFGNEVGLKSGTGRTLVSLSVDFQSYACETSGHWNGVLNDGTTPSLCKTADPGATFQWPITANIYAVDNSGSTPKPGTLLATDTETQTIPYRPSADPSCPANGGPAVAGAAWFNPQAVGGGACQNSIGKVLLFNNWTFENGFTGSNLPDNVIWTVAFNTTHYGNSPAGESTTCFQAVKADPQQPGCPYDSLNVGDNGNPGGLNPNSHITNAPYAGTDTDPNGAFLSSTSGGAYCDGGTAGTGFLRLDTNTTNDCWLGFRPLGEIITTAP